MKPSIVRLAKKLLMVLALTLVLLAIPLVVSASSVDEAIVDTTAPAGSVTLAPGASAPITINLTVTGNQVGTATFDVYRDWTLSGGAFTGSKPETFTVPPRAAQDPATTFSTTGTVSVDSGQAGGTFTLAVKAFNITNSNQTGAKLAVGNSSSYQVTVSSPSDTTPPTVSISGFSPNGSGGWFKAGGTPATGTVNATDPSNVTAINCTDSLGGLTLGPLTGGDTTSASRSLSVTGDGIHNISCSATDGAGNTNTSSTTPPSATAQVKIDTTPPQLASCDAPDGLWHANNVTLNCTYTDGGSGPGNQQVGLSTNVPVGSETANATASANGAQACDAAGNCATTPANITGNMIDRKLPQLASCDAPDSQWHANNVTLYCTYTDGGSGPASQQVALTTNVQAGTETNNAVASAGGAKACDNVGNCADSPADIGGNMIDRKPPTVTCQAASFILNQPGALVYATVTDDGSGAAASPVSAPASTGSVGTSFSVSLTGNDKVGNNTTQMCPYAVHYNYSGLLPPITADSRTTFKLGSTIPVKFQLTDWNGNPVGTAVATLTIHFDGSDTSTATEVEAVSTSAADTGNTFRYDPTGLQYIFNWGTKGLWAGHYTLTVNLGDGTTPTGGLYLKSK